MDYKNEFHSDDDFDSSNGYGDNINNNGNSGNSRFSNPNGLSKAELRKTNKPIMEKRRRARINHCLNELKSLILEAMKKDPARHTKLEKADILEMTVKHLQSVQRQQLNMAIQTDPTVIHKFKTGFVECADEVNRFISQLEGVDNAVRQRLTNHLNNCATSLEQIGSMTNFNNGYRGQLGPNIFGSPLVTPATNQLTTPPAVIFPPLPQDLNNNSNQGNTTAPIQMGGMQLIPSRLPSGEFALVMPNTPQNVTNTVNNILNVNNANSVSPFSAAAPTWPTVPAIATVNANKTNVIPTAAAEFTTNFQRNSAFSKPVQKIVHNNNNTSSPYTNSTQQIQHHTTTPITAFQQSQNGLHHNSTMTTSPPLSPISSISSHGDDSIMHTSSDFNNTSSRPVTPPLDVSHTIQHSFSGVFTTPPTSADTSLNVSRISSASLSSSTSSASSTHLQQQQVSSTSGSEARSNGSRKRSLTSDGNDSSDSSEEPTSKKFISNTGSIVVVGDEERDSMWRPW